MLVLTRKEGESVIIGEDGGSVKVMVVSVGRGKVRLGIEAPDDVCIIRDELLNRGEDPGRRPSGKTASP